MTPHCFMASVDLKDAYYSIPVARCHRKYLRFVWKGHLLQFTCLPNGLSEAPRKFTKIMKPPFSNLRKTGHENTAYLDDSWLMATNFGSCQNNAKDTVNLLDSLGFTIHPEKSCLHPTCILIYLGFILNSILIRVSLTPEKAETIREACFSLLNKDKCSIRELARVIGLCVAVEPGVEGAPLFHRWTEHEKIKP